MERTRPHGRVVGIDLIPAQPPRGVATFQGDFLSPAVQRLVKDYLVGSRTSTPPPSPSPPPSPQSSRAAGIMEQPSYIDQERHMPESAVPEADAAAAASAPPVDTGLVDVSPRAERALPKPAPTTRPDAAPPPQRRGRRRLPAPSRRGRRR